MANTDKQQQLADLLNAGGRLDEILRQHPDLVETATTIATAALQPSGSARTRDRHTRLPGGV